MKDNFQQLLGFLDTEPGRSLECQSQVCSLLDRQQQFTVNWSRDYILLFQSVKHLEAAEWGQNNIIGAMGLFLDICPKTADLLQQNYLIHKCKEDSPS